MSTLFLSTLKYSRPITISLFLSAILISAVLRLSSLEYKYWNPDEIISIAVAERILEKGTLDTSWKKADLPDQFKYPQYNFSTYLLSSALLIKAVNILPLINEFETLDLLRAYSAFLGIIAVALTFLVGRQLHSTATGILAACIAATTPLLYQDSLYARPETFTTALTLLFVYLLGLSKINTRIRIFSASLIFGLMVATKISLLALLPILLLKTRTENAKIPHPSSSIVDYIKSSILYGLKSSPIILAGVTFGFFAGAPYAIINLGDYINGILALSKQYTTGHWPHGLVEGNSASRGAYALNYFTSTAGGALVLFSFIGGCLTFYKKNYRFFFIFILVLIFSIRFGTYPVFFERNFSHVFPFIIIFASSGILQTIEVLTLRPAFKVSLLCIAVFITIYPGLKTSLKIRLFELPGRQLELVDKMRSGLESRFGISATQTGWVHTYSGLKKKLDKNSCTPSLLEIPYPNDRYSIKLLDGLKLNYQYREVGRVPSLFIDSPPSTLHTYFTPTTIFLFSQKYTPKGNSGKCNSLVSKHKVGNPLQIISVTPEHGWKKYINKGDPFIGKSFFSSRSGAGLNKGKLNIKIDNRCQSFVLPYKIGRNAMKQSIIVSNSQSNKTVWKTTNLDPAKSWRFLVVPVKGTCEKLTVRIMDSGSEWNEWFSVGIPRFLK